MSQQAKVVGAPAAFGAPLRSRWRVPTGVPVGTPHASCRVLRFMSRSRPATLPSPSGRGHAKRVGRAGNPREWVESTARRSLPVSAPPIAGGPGRAATIAQTPLAPWGGRRRAFPLARTGASHALHPRALLRPPPAPLLPAPLLYEGNMKAMGKKKRVRDSPMSVPLCPCPRRGIMPTPVPPRSPPTVRRRSFATCVNSTISGAMSHGSRAHPRTPRP